MVGRIYRDDRQGRIRVGILRQNTKTSEFRELQTHSMVTHHLLVLWTR